jgi:thioredoxin-dependent peroxiredoxin
VAKVNVGDRAPDFELPGTGGRTYRLSDYASKGVILAFYPGDFTPVCTRQFCSYRDAADRIGHLPVDLVGISPQSVESHERFRGEHGLTIPLLADEAGEVARTYGVVGPKNFIRRSIFVIDADLVVRHKHVALVGMSYQGVEELEEAAALLVA